jgi:hypothetical protein
MKNFFLKCTIVLFFFKASALNAQDLSVVKIDSLQQLAKLIQHGANDSIRISSNKIFKAQLISILSQGNTADLDSLKSISVLNSPDHSFTLLTWQLPSYDGSYSYYGFIRVQDKKTSESKILELVDSTYAITNPETAKLSPGKWFGAVYYKIIPVKKDGKFYYSLLGWKGNNPVTTYKVIDALYFSGSNPIFGYPIYKLNKVYKSRVVFEYPAQAVMSLRYEEKRKMIVFDHLSAGKKKPDASQANGPDGTYDAFKLVKDHWELVEDIDVNTGFIPKSENAKPIKDEDLKK